MNISMKARLSILLALVTTLITGGWVHAQLAGTSLHRTTYRGYLEDSTGPLDGMVDLEFELYGAPSGGTALTGTPLSAPDTPVHDGHFSVDLDLPPDALGAAGAWLEIRVDGEQLQGRQELRSVPFAANGSPAGTIAAFGGNVPPAGWMMCNGAALRSSEYPALYAAISTAWGNGSAGAGAGNGTNFNAPDLRGRFLRGVDDGAGRDANAAARFSEMSGATGDNPGSVQGFATALPQTSFTVGAGAHTHSYADNSGWSSCNTPANVDCTDGESGSRYDIGRTTDSGGGAHTHTLGGGDAESRPLNAAVRWIIKY
jgi:microcystin-dependent protein